MTIRLGTSVQKLKKIVAYCLTLQGFVNSTIGADIKRRILVKTFQHYFQIFFDRWNGGGGGGERIVGLPKVR